MSLLDRATAETVRARRSRLGLCALLGFMGTMHFVQPKYFDPLIPAWLPGKARHWTHGSGVAELVSSALLSNTKTKRAGGYVAAATLATVFVGNVKMAVDNPPTNQLGVISWVRLPLQWPLFRWAMAQTRVKR